MRSTRATLRPAAAARDCDPHHPNAQPNRAPHDPNPPDWSVARSIWNKNGPHAANIEAVSREGCRLLKANHSATKCFIYHNMELALESIESQRAAMYPGGAAYNPALFLQYKNGTIYNERGTPGDQVRRACRRARAVAPRSCATPARLRIR